MSSRTWTLVTCRTIGPCVTVVTRPRIHLSLVIMLDKHSLDPQNLDVSADVSVDVSVESEE